MGLDITAVSQAVKTDLTFEQYDEDSALWDTHEHIWEETDFPARADGLPAGVYRVDGETLGFRAGSYGGYNAWRDTLSRTMLGVSAETVWANRQGYQEAPFYPLIDFSNCEGVIGPQTSALLARAFARFAAKAAAVPDDYWREKYALWHRAFTLAADHGFVRFH